MRNAGQGRVGREAILPPHLFRIPMCFTYLQKTNLVEPFRKSFDLAKEDIIVSPKFSGDGCPSRDVSGSGDPVLKLLPKSLQF